MQNAERPAEPNVQQTVKYAVHAAIPALLTVVDQRVETALGTAVATIEAAANRVEAATQRRMGNPRRSNNKGRIDPDEYDGDTEVTPTKSRGPKSTKINKQHVRFHHLFIYFKLSIFLSKGIHQELACGSRCPS
jgi:hypothetical protein